ncbi:MAG: hypothetical protein WC823_06605 [Parcubacteria group bacterium]|jgi:hypothetical protein
MLSIIGKAPPGKKCECMKAIPGLITNCPATGVLAITLINR